MKTLLGLVHICTLAHICTFAHWRTHPGATLVQTSASSVQAAAKHQHQPFERSGED